MESRAEQLYNTKMACTKPELSKVRINLNNSLGTCRVCMRKSKFMKALFSSDCKIVTRIQFCTGILLTENPILPSLICAECLSQLNIAHNFKTTCIESENTFRQLEVKVAVLTQELDDPTEEIEYLDEDKAEIDDLREIELLEKESVNPTINGAKCEAIPNATKNSIKLKEIPDSTTVYIPKVTPLSRRGNIIKQDQAISIASTQTIKLKVVNCSPKVFNLKCNENEKQIPKKRKRNPIHYRKSCCLKCNIRFETKEESIQHNNDIHNLCTKFVCEVCGKEFTTSQLLYSHKRIHVGPLCACAHCSYATVNKTDLKKHLAIHTGEKNFHCHACTMTCRTSSNLHYHIRLKHSAERTIICDFCKKNFFTKQCLNKHMNNVHCKRYVCSVCHFRFTLRALWKRHMLIEHAIDVPPAKRGRRKTDLSLESTPSIYDEENAKIKHNLNVN